MTAKTGEKGVKNISDTEHLRKVLAISTFDDRPTLLYFHYDHDDGAEGKTSAKQCKVLNDEKVARWMALYHAVEVDVKRSDPAFARKLGAGDEPSFVIVDKNLKILAQSPVMPNAKRVVAFLQTSVKSKCSKYWTSVKKRIDAQKAVLKEARALRKKKDFKKALEKFNEVTASQLRIDSHWDEAVREQAKVSRKAKKDS